RLRRHPRRSRGCPRRCRAARSGASALGVRRAHADAAMTGPAHRPCVNGTAGLILLEPSALVRARDPPFVCPFTGSNTMNAITTEDGVEIFFKDWGPRNAQPLVFHHGWPLSADDWDAQLLYFLDQGYRVVAHDRRGHGRSSQVSDGHDMDHYAADIAAVVE